MYEVEKKMFYKANPLIFKRAKELRNNVTHTEMLMWHYLVTRPLGYKFRRQHPFYNYIADFYCHALRLVIEIDGSIHNRADVKEYDKERENIIRSLGIEVLRFTNADVLHRFDFVISSINIWIQNTLTTTQKEGLTNPPLGG